MHLGVEIGEASSREGIHLPRFKLVSHTYLELSRDHRDVLALGMPVWGDLIAVRHFDTDREIAGAGARIAFQNRYLSARRDERRRRAILHLIGNKRVLWRTRLSQQHSSANTQGQENRSFHLHFSSVGNGSRSGGTFIP